MAQGDDDEDEEIARLIRESFAEQMPGIRELNDRLRREISQFFGIAVEHLPAPQTLGWHRLLGTYVYGRRLKTMPNAANELSHALDGHLYRDERPS